ncbi:hypothetical protein CWO84_15025 [Methylomonas sp. Kb3]|uniref:caspase family protein n=1 Tax=Methylomonas sp. Kb3 TaxID=1611544 RepID=UPI000C31F2AF|nr:caspase family protein [Methylomonas sp. Kb3]PKD39515.1 hypothetical protein CWO84_15025 [Methylomonas sp. Kb3]
MAIKRQAILIGAPSVKPELPGVIKDINDFKSFLLSDKGGVWKPTEITTLIDQSPFVVKAHIRLAQSADYVFILCAGHGEHRVGRNLDETVMYLNEKDTISINEVNPQTRRHLVIVDTCRVLVEVKKLAMEARAEAALTLDFAETHVDYRQVFDDAILNTSEGRIVAYSCDINQAAGDDGSGGVFTQALLSSANTFKPIGYSKYDIVNISQAFDVAKELTYKKNAPQSPVFNAGRRRDYFPFCIATQGR